MGKEFLPEADAGAWSLQLPPATVELQVLPFWYAVKPPRIHGAGVSALRGLGGARGLPARRHDVPVAGGPAHRRVHARCQYERHVGHHASPQTPPLHRRQREDG